MVLWVDIGKGLSWMVHLKICFQGGASICMSKGLVFLDYSVFSHVASLSKRLPVGWPKGGILEIHL